MLSQQKTYYRILSPPLAKRLSHVEPQHVNPTRKYTISFILCLASLSPVLVGASCAFWKPFDMLDGMVAREYHKVTASADF